MEENKVLVEMQQIPRDHTSSNYSDFVSCDMCHHNAFFQYQFNGELLHRCQMHSIKDITKLKGKWGFSSK